MRFMDLVGASARQAPEKLAVIEGERQLSFAEIDDRIARLGGALRAAGLQPGDRVALLAWNELEQAELQGACLRSGFVLVPLNTRLSPPEIEFILSDVRPSVFIVGRELEELAEATLARLSTSLPTYYLDPDRDGPCYDDLLASGEADPSLDPDDPHLPATILYTSGTTGRPKGAVIDRAALTARMMAATVELEVTSDDVWLQPLPMFHIASIGAFTHLSRGATVVLQPMFDPSGCYDLLTQHRCTGMVLVPTLIDMLLAAPEAESFDNSNLRIILYGGAPIQPTLLRSAMEQFECKFEQWYGQTELSGATVLRPRDHDPDDDEKLDSAGVPMYSYEVAIFDLDDRPVEDGEVGEVVARGPGAMSEYWERPDETAATVRGGWLHTGDLGYRDERGFIHLTDRRNDLIITGGENVYPREVEFALVEHPKVQEIAVIGTPDDRWGEMVTAFVIGEATDEELDAFARENLANYKVPRRWVRLEELPKTVTGKVQKPPLREMLSAGGG